MAEPNGGPKKEGVDTVISPEASAYALTDGLGPSWMFWRRRRYVVALMAFLGFFNVYALRVNLSVAIVAMTSANTTGNGEDADFEWSKATQGMLLSSFFYGYIVTQLPGGWLAARVGGKRVYGVGLLGTAVLTLLTPPLTSAGAYVLLTVRVIEGLFEGVTYPCMHAVWARWAPPQERSRLATLAFSGSYVGTVVSMPVCGLLAKTVGWPFIFYVFGSICVVWFVAWWVFVAEGPEVDSRISTEELHFIQASLGKVVAAKDIVLPWKKILTSMPVWAIVCAHFCENWGFYTMLTQLPSFMNDTLHFDIKEAGFMSALPYLAMATILQFAGHIADYLVNKNYLTTTQVRKVFNCTAFLSQTIFMLLAAHLFTPGGIVACLTLAVGLGAFAWSGFSVNHLDIAPQHASVLMGVSNTVATLPGIVSPLLTGYIVPNKAPSEWRVVFYIASGIYLAGAIFYGVFASGERQSWSYQEEAEAPGDSDLPQKDSKENHSYSNPAVELDHV